MPGSFWRSSNLTEAIGFRTRTQKATVIAAGLLGIVLAAPIGIALSLPVVMRFFPGADVSRMPIYRPVLTVLAPEDSPLTAPFRNAIAKGYYEWCTLFGEENRVKVMVMWNSPTMNGLMQINPVEVPDVSIGFRNLAPETWAEMNRERVDR
jgi:hypothetical protein